MSFIPVTTSSVTITFLFKNNNLISFKVTAYKVMKKCIHTINGGQVKNTQRHFLTKGNFDFSMEGQFCSMINKNKLVYKICGGLLTLIEKK